MIRWLIVVFLALILFNGLMPWLQKLGFGRLPGDFRFRLFGREWFIPLTTTLLLSGLASLVSRLIGAGRVRPGLETRRDAPMLIPKGVLIHE